MKKTIEQKTAETILDAPQIITINGKKYTVPNPTTATLIAVSGLISTLPKAIGDGNIVQFVLGTAKDCEPIGDIMATLILGKKRNSHPIINRYREAKQKKLATKILNEFTPKQLNETMPEILKRMEITDFFAATTFLIEINMLQATRKVETKTTASGQ